MSGKILIVLAPLAINIALGFVTGKASKTIDSKVNSKALALGLTFVVGGLSFLASTAASKMQTQAVADLVTAN